MVSGITPCAQECKWTDYFGEPPKTLESNKSVSPIIMNDAAGFFTGS